GRRHDPMFIAQDPSAADFDPLPTADTAAARRLEGCSDLLQSIDWRSRELDSIARVRDFSDYHQQAFSMVTSAAARRAFSLSAEPASVRDRYGRSAFGQGCLLARRLVEAGVRLVTVNWARDDAFWDTHANNFR